jgi:DNA-binding transcriptional MerR regulator
MSNQGNDAEQQIAELDLEWVYLMMSAKKAGLRIEEIRQFLSERTLQAM